jgi:hypothetical protein
MEDTGGCCMELRFGRRAVYQGNEWELIRFNAQLDEYVIRELTDNGEGDTVTRAVSKAELDEAFHICNKCIYQGEEAQIDGYNNGSFQLSRSSEGQGFLPVDWDLYVKEVPANDRTMERIWEERQPLAGFEVKEAMVMIKE